MRLATGEMSLALMESSSIRVRLSTYTVGTPWMRPIQANGTARPAPVVRMADGPFAPNHA